MNGKALKERLVRITRLQQKEIAEKMNMSPQLLNQALNATDVKSGFIERLSTALDIPLACLYSADYDDAKVPTYANISHDAYNALLQIFSNYQHTTERFQNQIDRLINLLEKK